MSRGERQARREAAHVAKLVEAGEAALSADGFTVGPRSCAYCAERIAHGVEVDGRFPMHPTCIELSDPKESPSPRSKLAEAAVDWRRAALEVKSAECQSPDPDYGPCSNCAACVEKARAKGEKSSALSRLRYWADKVIAETQRRAP